jgi:hypothetical protein
MSTVVVLLNLILLSIVCYTVWKRNNTTALNTWFWPSLLLHALSGTFIGLLYRYYYGEGDTLHYFEDACILSELAREDMAGYLKFLWNNSASDEFWQTLYYREERAVFFTKIVSLANLLSFDNYWVSALYFSIMSFFSAWKFAATLNKWLTAHMASIVFSFLLFPSLVLWRSGIVKEAVAMACVFSICTVFLFAYKREKIHWPQWILSILSIWLLYSVKYYYLAVLFPVLGTTLLYQRFIQKRITSNSFLKEIVSWALLFLFLTLLVTSIHPNFYPNRFLWVMYNNYRQFVSYSHAEDVMLFSTFNESWWALLINSPWALVSGLFRPFVWEAGNTFQLIASLENLLIFALTIPALPALFKIRQAKDRILIFAALIFCLILSIFLTLSTPNFGTLIRYRVGFLPFFIFLVTLTNPIFNLTVVFLQTYWEKLVTRKQ